jgi:hypothetical protein
MRKWQVLLIVFFEFRIFCNFYQIQSEGIVLLQNVIQLIPKPLSTYNFTSLFESNNRTISHKTSNVPTTQTTTTTTIKEENVVNSLTINSPQESTTQNKSTKESVIWTPSTLLDKNFYNLFTLQGLKNFIKAMTPLLLECWVECGPSIVTLENIPHFKLILQIWNILFNQLSLYFNQTQKVQTLNHTTKESLDMKTLSKIDYKVWLRKHFFDQMKKYILVYFPFSTNPIWEEKVISK